MNKFYSTTPEWVKPILTQLSQKYGVDTYILSSQINHESGFRNIDSKPNNDAHRSYDRGIAQINNYWHPEISDAQAHDVNFSLDWMARTMSEKKTRLGDWGKALSEYNTGNSNDGFKNGYVNKILGNANQPSSEARLPDFKKNEELSNQKLTEERNTITPRMKFEADFKKNQETPKKATGIGDILKVLLSSTPQAQPMNLTTSKPLPVAPTLPDTQYTPSFTSKLTYNPFG